MSFRNIKSESRELSKPAYDTLQSSQQRSADERMWQNRYLEEVGNFAVANWIPIVVGIIAGVGGAVGGFFLGQKYSSAKMGKDLAAEILPESLKETEVGKKVYDFFLTGVPSKGPHYTVKK